MWYTSVEMVSGKKKNVYFVSEKEAWEFYRKVYENDKRFFKLQYDGMLINFSKIETVSKPKIYNKKESN